VPGVFKGVLLESWKYDFVTVDNHSAGGKIEQNLSEEDVIERKWVVAAATSRTARGRRTLDAGRRVVSSRCFASPASPALCPQARRRLPGVGCPASGVLFDCQITQL
jgi:hypothetical protein